LSNRPDRKITLFLGLIILLLTILTRHSILLFFLYLIASGVLFFVFFKRQRMSYGLFRGALDEMEGKVNLLEAEVIDRSARLQELPGRCDRAAMLFEASQRLVKLADYNATLDSLVDVTGGLFPAANVLLFTMEKDRPVVARSFKRAGGVIREKYGDAIDNWVLKNSQSLLLEDITKDFRFDYSRINTYRTRHCRSVIASPLAIGSRVLGLIRVEHFDPGVFTMNDSRILRAVADLGAVVLEKADVLRATEELAIRDPLTSLFLKDYFFQRFKEELSRAGTAGNKVGLAMLDVDDFKKVNDTHGHIVGDIVLKRLAASLVEIVGDSGNLACRFGGEEFLFYLVASSREQLADMAEAVRKKVESTPVNFRRKKVQYTVSIGAAQFPEDGHDLLSLIDKADHNLYKAKHNGKNCLVI
jgi:diguanylate cyclase (GGDEF)-like protein